MKRNNEYRVHTPKDIIIPCITYYKDDKRTLPFSDPMLMDCDYDICNVEKFKDVVSFDLFDDQGYICTMKLSKDYFNKLK